MADNRYGDQRESGWSDRDRARGDGDRGWRDEPRARSGWGPAEGRSGRGRDEDEESRGGFFERAGEEIRSWFSDDEDERGSDSRGRSRPDFGRGASGGRGDFQRRPEQRGHAQSWGEANRGDNWRSSRQSEDSGSGQDSGSGFGDRNFGFNDLSGTTGGFGNQRFGSGQDDHYLNWRNRQLEQLDQDYQEYCREREQQFRQDFDSWRSSRKPDQSSEPQSRESGSRESGSKKSGKSESGAGTASSASSGSASFLGSGSDPSAATAGGGGDPTPEPTAPTGTRNSRSRS